MIALKVVSEIFVWILAARRKGCLFSLLMAKQFLNGKAARRARES